jgi:hypothetical protein
MLGEDVALELLDWIVLGELEIHDESGSVELGAASTIDVDDCPDPDPDEKVSSKF